MKQILQHLRTGVVEVADVPAPGVRPGHLLIRTRASLISAGTERMLVEFGKGNLLAKARAQPDKVRQVLDKIKTEGLMPTLEAVFARLDEPLPLGYCNAGEVIEVGAGVEGFRPGDCVISNGPHAEIVCVPVNLCAKIPEGVAYENAAFCVLCAIALQGIRLLQPTLGERFVVTGLGLIGLIAVQLLRAHGCRVLGIDLDPKKIELARSFGAETFDASAGGDPVTAAGAFAGGRGVDGVLITASSKSNDIVHQAAQMCRKRGRIVLVGVVGLELRRADFYEKELTFQVSCSYGPGRYDAAYEEQGRDYPLGFVRWTEQRNFEAVLDMMATGGLDVARLIERQIPHGEAPRVYDDLAGRKDALGLILTYPQPATEPRRVIELGAHEAGALPGPEDVVLGAIGAGNFAKLVLLPAFRQLPVRLRTIASRGGVSAAHLGRKLEFERVSSDYRDILDDPSINAVAITTRHNSHARLTIEALNAGKHVFVEKPLALTDEELEAVAVAHERAGRQLLVGFNRRFSPHVGKIREILRGRSEPLSMIMTVNAGFIPADHWTQDAEIGGGRIIGEACHWLDLLAHLADSRIESVFGQSVENWPGPGSAEDKVSLSIQLADGSIGTIHYFANGDKGFPKERLEVFYEQKVLRLDNFKELRGFGTRGFRRFKTRRIDKGHAEEVRAFVRAIAEGGRACIPFSELAGATLASFAAVRSIRERRPVEVGARRAGKIGCTAAENPATGGITAASAPQREGAAKESC